MNDFLDIGRTGLRAGRTLVTNGQLVERFNQERVTNDAGVTYRFVNTFNPQQRLSVSSRGLWSVPHESVDYPVVGINAAGALLYAQSIGARIPTHSEWRLLAGNGKYPWGDNDPSERLANYGQHVGAATSVGSYPPCAYGLLDLAGNVGEWCLPPQNNHPEWIVAGGSWDRESAYLQSSVFRTKWRRIGTMSIGFRCVQGVIG